MPKPIRRFSSFLFADLGATVARAAASMAVGTALALGAGAASAADLDIEISGITVPEGATGAAGQVMVAAFGADNWLRAPTAVGKAALSEVRNGVVTVRLTGLPAGPIAVSVFQDVNGNGKLDSSPVGMPVEPYAFSRQAQGHYGPPSFKDAVLEAGTTRHAIRLPAQ